MATKKFIPFKKGYKEPKEGSKKDMAEDKGEYKKQPHGAGKKSKRC
jgi:hypothetical protein